MILLARPERHDAARHAIEQIQLPPAILDERAKHARPPIGMLFVCPLDMDKPLSDFDSRQFLDEDRVRHTSLLITVVGGFSKFERKAIRNGSVTIALTKRNRPEIAASPVNPGATA